MPTTLRQRLVTEGAWYAPTPQQRDALRTAGQLMRLHRDLVKAVRLHQDVRGGV